MNKWSKAGGIRTLRYVIKALEGFKVPRVLLCIDSNFHLVIQNDIFSFKFQLRVELTVGKKGNFSDRIKMLPSLEFEPGTSQ